MNLEKKRESINYKLIVKSTKVSANNSIKKAEAGGGSSSASQTVDLTNRHMRDGAGTVMQYPSNYSSYNVSQT